MVALQYIHRRNLISKGITKGDRCQIQTTKIYCHDHQRTIDGYRTNKDENYKLYKQKKKEQAQKEENFNKQSEKINNESEQENNINNRELTENDFKIDGFATDDKITYLITNTLNYIVS